MKRALLILMAIMTLAAPAVVTSTSYAQAAPTSNNPIQDGLWQAYNSIFGSTSTPPSTTTPTTSPAPVVTQEPTQPANTSNPIIPGVKADPNRKIYVAMGDSIAAGLGLTAASSATSTDKACGRSSQAYGGYVARSAGLPYVNVACSGATAGDLFTRQYLPDRTLHAQLTYAYAAGKPQLITITSGANDANWADFIKACYAYNCATTPYTIAADSQLIILKAKLYAAFEAIKYKSNDQPPTTVITGYYNPVSANCSNYQTAVTPAELTWIATETNKLNTTIQSVAANYSFVKYVPVSFAGHDLCSANPWIQGTTAAAPFHPTVTGQKVIANNIISALKQ